MYTTIAVPVDLAHVERLSKALRTAADLARHYGASLVYVGAVTETPGPVARSPAAYAAKLEAFAAEQAAAHGIAATGRMVVSLDMTVDLEPKLLAAIDEAGADLVVMASHVPGLREHLFSSHAGWLAAHASVSVFIVR